MILSSLATCALEDVAAAAPGGLRWMQIYVFRDRSVTADLVARAVDAGYRALVLTADAPVSGLRGARSARASTCPTTSRCRTSAR